MGCGELHHPRNALKHVFLEAVDEVAAPEPCYKQDDAEWSFKKTIYVIEYDERNHETQKPYEPHTNVAMIRGVVSHSASIPYVDESFATIGIWPTCTQ